MPMLTQRIIIIFLILNGFNSFSQSIEWQNTIGGSGLDELFQIQNTSDGGYICGGRSNSDISGEKLENSLGFLDYWVIKLDSIGSIQWQNTIGGSSWDGIYSIQATNDGGYICGGYSVSDISGDKTEISQGGTDYWIVKIDAIGNIQWQNTIGGSNDDQLYSIQQTGDGGYICGGMSSSNISGDKTENGEGAFDYWIVPLDSVGTIQWQNTIGGSSFDYFKSIQQTSDGGYICGGYSDSNISGDKTENSLGVWDYWVVRLDSNGSILWQNTIGGNHYDALYSIQQTTDGGYICGGWSNSDLINDKTEACLGVADYWVVKLDNSGNIIWQNTIGGNFVDELKSIQQTSDGGYICGGNSYSTISGDKSEDTLGYEDYWIVKISSTGNIQWQKTIGGSQEDRFSFIQQTMGGGFVCAGSSKSDISGHKTENCQGDLDFWIVKIGPVFSSINLLEMNLEKFKIFPNPVTSYLSIKELSANSSIRLFTLTGKLILFQIASEETTLDLSNIDQGVYFLQVGNGVKKIVKI